LTLLVCPSCRSPLAADAARCSRCEPDPPGVPPRDGPTPWAASADPDTAGRLAQALGAQYEVTRFLGRGGFAEVYEVRDLDLQRRLAVKVLRPDLSWTGGMLTRFKQEARAVARLNHPNTVPIHFVGEGEGLVYYAMPFVEGQSLGDLLRIEGALDAVRTVAIAAPVLEALDFAHRNGLVHRDIKPDNILIESGTGRPLLLDFGIAKNVDGGNVHQTESGFVVGTPLYMSPEQALGQPNVDARADVYAMGTVLFQMLTGSPPFEGSTSQEIVSKHLTEPIPVPTTRNVRIPRWLSDIIIRCMAKRPAERYQSAAELLAALLHAPSGAGARQAITATRVVAQLGRDAPTLEMEPAQLPLRERPMRWGWAAAVVALALILAGGASVWRSSATAVLQNRLVEPITITVDGTEHLVPPGDSLRLRLTRGAALHADWHSLRPRSGAGVEMGLALRGAVRDEEPHGEIRRSIDMWTLGRGYVAPVVTNATTGPLKVMLRDEHGAPLDCGCTVAAGATTSLGYRDPVHLGAIDFTDANGRTARVSSIASFADRSTGAASIRLAPDDFSAPAPAAQRRRAVAADSPPAPRLLPITDSVPLPASDTAAVAPNAPPRRPAPAQIDPLRGTVTNH
jgi:protein kinase-like protein